MNLAQAVFYRSDACRAGVLAAQLRAPRSKRRAQRCAVGRIAERITALLEAHPGAELDDLECAGEGCANPRQQVTQALSYLRRDGVVRAEGPRLARRYYLTGDDMNLGQILGRMVVCGDLEPLTMPALNLPDGKSRRHVQEDIPQGGRPSGPAQKESPQIDRVVGLIPPPNFHALNLREKVLWAVGTLPDANTEEIMRLTGWRNEESLRATLRKLVVDDLLIRGGKYGRYTYCRPGL